MRIELKLAHPLCPVYADATYLRQAVLNFAANSRAAMPEGGTFTLRTAGADLDEDAAARHEGVSPGRYVVLSVTDTGAGMTPEVLARAFDPFFTTRQVGQGSGLGLSMAHGFARQCGGFVEAQSAPGQGTTISLALPCHRPGGEIQAVPASA